MTYILVVLSDGLLGEHGDESGSLFLVGRVVNSGGVDVVSSIARGVNQTDAQAIVDALNAAS